ncbi:MAG TPA: hypothetical protein VLH10_02490, partial [Yinghuangia sp.]|nr:hypothetical protein [Yinghuangia sp.]
MAAVAHSVGAGVAIAGEVVTRAVVGVGCPGPPGLGWPVVDGVGAVGTEPCVAAGETGGADVIREGGDIGVCSTARTSVDGGVTPGVAWGGADDGVSGGAGVGDADRPSSVG